MAKAPAVTTKKSQAPANVQVVESPFKITSAKDVTRYLKLMIYGKYGIGKTTLAGTSCVESHMKDILMINAEAGDLSLAELDDLDVVRTSSYRQVAKVIEYLRLHCKYRIENNTEKLCELESKLRGEEVTVPKKYNTLIIDSLAEVESFCMYQLLGITDKTRLDDEAASPEWAEYRKNYGMIQRLVRAARDLPMHVIFTCPEQYIQDETKKFLYKPNLTGKLSSEVQGFMDMVGFLVIERNDEGKLTRRLYVQPTGKFDAKNRFSTFKGTFFEEPTIGKILKAIGIKN